MLPRLRLVIATLAAVFITAAALGVLSASRSGSHFALGPRAATGSPLEQPCRNRLIGGNPGACGLALAEEFNSLLKRRNSARHPAAEPERPTNLPSRFSRQCKPTQPP